MTVARFKTVPPAQVLEALERDIAGRGGALPHVSDGAKQALRLAKKIDLDMGEMIDLIEGDPALSSRILLVANSAMYSRGNAVRSVERAVVRVGLQATREILHHAVFASVREEAPVSRSTILEAIEAGMLRGAAELPALPKHARDLLCVARNPLAELDEVITLIEGDPDLAQKVVDAANGANFSNGFLVSTVRRAVAQIGLQKTREILYQAVYGALVEAQERSLVAAELIDPVTGLMNRRGGEKAIRTALRAGTPTTLVAFEIDHFDVVKDAHGREACQQLLREVASILQRSARRGDVLLRYRGERFFLLVRGADPRLAAAIGERYRAAIEGAVLSAKTGTKRATVSVGVLVWRGSEDELTPTAERLVALVEGALEDAKRAGRNCVVTQVVSSERVLGSMRPRPSGVPSSRKSGDPR